MAVPVWVDQSGATPGTSLTAANLNAMTAADATEAATNDTLGGSSTWVNNLNRLRYVLGQIQSGAWNAATAMIPLAQRGAASGVARLDSAANLIIESGKKLTFPGQTAGGSSGVVANQGVGTFSIPSGTNVTTGGALNVNNSLVTANSIILLTLVGNPDVITRVTHVRSADVAGTSFNVGIYGSGTTAVAVDVHYVIIN